ncbi:hypothetical protein NL676_002746 [Syzygium grande]|nr:hypothetical protein NL676_002746 [Syzygium grande]
MSSSPLNMVATNSGEAPVRPEPGYDCESELKAFDTSRTGVKGLVDTGVSKLPRIFVVDRRPQSPNRYDPAEMSFGIPVVDLEGVHEDPGKRGEMIRRVGQACEDWGFFQVVNHGIGDGVLSGILDGVRRLHEQESEAKMEFPQVCRSFHKLF